MAFLQDIFNQFSSLGQLPQARQQAANAAQQSNTTYAALQKKVPTASPRFPSTNAQSASQSALMGATAKAPTIAPVSNTIPANMQKPAILPTAPPSQGAGTSGGNTTSGTPEFTGYYQGNYDAQGNKIGFATPAGTVPAGTNPAQQTVNVANQPTPQPYTVNNGLYGQLITGLANTALTGNNPAIAQTQQELSDLGKQYAQQTANIGGSRTNLAEAGGEQGLLQNLYQNTRAPLETQLQQQTAQQQLQQQGLYEAGALAQPQSYGMTSTPYNPATGQFGTLPSGGQGASGLFNQGQTIGAFTAGQNQVPLTQGVTAAEGIHQTIDSYLQQNPQLNPTASTVLNGLGQWFYGGQLGDAKYQTLANYLTDYSTKMAPILAAGNVSNMKLLLQQSMVNPQASGKSISEVLAQLGALAQSNLANFASGAQGGGVVAGGSSVANVPGGTNPPTGGYTFGNGSFFGK